MSAEIDIGDVLEILPEAEAAPEQAPPIMMPPVVPSTRQVLEKVASRLQTQLHEPGETTPGAYARLQETLRTLRAALANEENRS